jgi:large repetitive protein
MGDPKGIQISHGELVSAPCDWTCFWIDANGQPNMGQVASKFTVTWPDGSVTPFGLNEARTPTTCVLYTEAVGESTRTTGGTELVLERAASASKWLPFEVGEDYVVVVREVREGGNSPMAPHKVVLSVGPKAVRNFKIQKGAVLRLSTRTEPSLKNAQTAISGGPALIKDGKITVGWSAVRHPRTALGWNKESIFLVEVDGRQAGYSVGMTYSELANYMQKLGCHQALNLDGGGSATFWMLGQVMNSPSEGQPRAVANGLVLLQKSAAATDSTSNSGRKSAVEED